MPLPRDRSLQRYRNRSMDMCHLSCLQLCLIELPQCKRTADQSQEMNSVCAWTPSTHSPLPDESHVHSCRNWLKCMLSWRC